MAEGIDESETNSNSGEPTSMLRAVMPCETLSPYYGHIKREIESTTLAANDKNSNSILHHHRHHRASPTAVSLKSGDYERHDGKHHSKHSLDKHLLTDHPLDGNEKYLHSLGKMASDNAAAGLTNGAMQDILNLQKLQSLAQFQNTHISQFPPGLQGLLGSTSIPPFSSPLNLSLGNPTLTNQQQQHENNNTMGVAPPMPQLILASGQLVQGIQGAQLLIPTSQGVVTQTVLTIPVSQQVASNITTEQLIQCLTTAKLNSTSASFRSISQPQSLPSPCSQTSSLSSGMLNSPVIPNGGQQYMAGLSTHLLHQQKPYSNPLKHHRTLEHRQSSPSLRVKSESPRITTPPQCLSRNHHPIYEKPATVTSSSASTTPMPHSRSHTPQPQPQPCQKSPAPEGGSSPLSNHASLSHSPNSQSHSNLSNISRLTSTNGELTITKTQNSANPAAMPSITSTNTSSTQSANVSGHATQSSTSSSSYPMAPMKTSNSAPVSPAPSECSLNELGEDPNELTINQATTNVVDGIDLDEIKEFAKAFKLRRLSLGLTQTQVGQALSVTEGPAYSQSAICSALAAQMYCAAQISSQQQQMFEKLDITPKSAQKIKPVLERWMKEAEERYKTGQNHLTDFIGVEPSKKRKRRTSFTPQALEMLNAHFERNTHPSGTEITGMAHQLGYEREVIRIWFCNKRQALKNTVRMMSKGIV